MFKVLHLWKSDAASAGGGGAAAMYRLHVALTKQGVDSKILCEQKRTSCLHTLQMRPRTRIERQTEKTIARLTRPCGLNDIHIISSARITKHPAYREADIITIHGTHDGFINYLALPTLTNEKPSVFVLHDMWAFTGHCAVSYGCDRWKIGCGNCPYLEAPPAVKRDNTRLEWKLKNWVYGRSTLTIVSPSTSLTEQAKQSMLSRFPIHHIPHGIDTDVFRPLDREQCRVVLGIPNGKKVLMVAATNLKQFNKGGDLLLRALESLPHSLKSRLLLLTLGNGAVAISKTENVEALNLGYLENDNLKALAYSAADLFVSPTRGEAFGLVILEGLACGTPAVAFKVGGVTDLVRPNQTGVLAEPENVRELRDGIIGLLEDEYQLKYMRERCRKLVLQEYRLGMQAQRYKDLYAKLKDGRSGIGPGC